MKHFAICMELGSGRVGLVHSCTDAADGQRIIEKWGPVAVAPGDTGRVGYVGCASFDEAVTRAGKMARDEAGAWGAA